MSEVIGNSDAETTYDDEKKGARGSFLGAIDLDQPLSRSDLQLFNQAIRAPRPIEIPEEWARKAAYRMAADFEAATSKRQRTSIFRAMTNAAQHNVEVAKYFAVLLKERDERDQTPVSAPSSAPALPAPEASPAERRKLLLDPAESMRLIHADKTLSALADELNEREARAKAAQSS